jgi:histidine triad (HIT) family protein
MSDRCLFCQLVEGDLPSHCTYQDALVVVALARRPLNPGHSIGGCDVRGFYPGDDRHG